MNSEKRKERPLDINSSSLPNGGPAFSSSSITTTGGRKTSLNGQQLLQRGSISSRRGSGLPANAGGGGGTGVEEGIVFKDVCVDVDAKRILWSVSGRAPPGRMLAIMGPSGKLVILVTGSVKILHFADSIKIEILLLFSIYNVSLYM